MRALVVYDSVFGNTEQVARAIGDALGTHAKVEVLRVADVTPGQLANVELLVVGSPTRAFRPTPAIRTLLKHIPRNGLKGATTAAFDTRMSLTDVNSRMLRFMAKMFGYAARPIHDALRSRGGRAAAPPEGFVVEDTEGPLREGELQRAADWARRILEAR